LAPQASQGIEALALADYDVQSWLLSSIDPEDQVAVVANGQTPLVSAAAMQLWGPNSVYFPVQQRFPTAAQLGDPPADVIAFYGTNAVICTELSRGYISDGLAARVIATTVIDRGGEPLNVCLLGTHP